MPVLTVRPEAPGRWGPSPARIATLGLLLPAVAAIGVASTSPSLQRIAVAIPAGAIIVAICLKSHKQAAMALLAWLAVLGSLRRIVFPSASGGSDPLLLVAPAVLGLLVVIAARKGAFRRPTRLARCVLVLSGLVVLAALNPLQGGIAVGAGGLLFVLVPPLWFWIGRGLLDDALLTRALNLVSFVAVTAALYGLTQVYSGFPTWDQRWIDTKGYTALYVGRSVRPFASFSSSSEYVGLLSVGIVIWALRLRSARLKLPVLAALALLAWALTVASVRGALVVVPIALGMMFAASHGFGLGRTVLTGIAALFLLGVVVSQFNASGISSELVSRQVSGLSDPFDPEKSTLPAHVDALVSGIATGVRNPVGQGLGVVTIAGEKFGSTTISTDVDPSNVAIAMGIPGLMAYGAVVVIGLRKAFSRARRQQDLLTLAALGIALVTLFQWLNGGNYSVAPLPWLLLGWLDNASPRSAPHVSTAPGILA